MILHPSPTRGWRPSFLWAGLALTASAFMASAETITVNIVHFSDYHSHAVPFYSEGAHNQAGIARGIAYLKAQRKADPQTLILNGGDTMNRSNPAWSDEYRCVEWSWFNGLVDAMALGNHEFDYGQESFAQCRSTIQYPILSANYVDANAEPLLLADNKPYLVKEIRGIKVGVFALADSDFDKLIGPENLATGARFVDRVETARRIVTALRDTEKVHAVVLFGHAYRESDMALARAVPGIDLILGTHSHYKGELRPIAESRTLMMSPFQYLTYFSNVQIRFSDGRLERIDGKLVRMDEHQVQDPAIAAQVMRMQQALEARHPERFRTLGEAVVELSNHNVTRNESVLGNWALDIVRESAATHAFFATASSFRASIAPGPISSESFFTALPYKNAIMVGQMSGQQLAQVIQTSVSRRDSDSFSQVSGVRFKMRGREVHDIQVLRNPADGAAGYAALDPDKTYRVGTTDFQATVSSVYKDLFSRADNLTNSRQDIGALLTATIARRGMVSARLDGRMGENTDAVAAEPPATEHKH